MRSVEERNYAHHNNAPITARPRIFFPSTSGKWKGVEVRRVILPSRMTEFTDAYITMGTPEYREMEKTVGAGSLTWLRALRLLRYVQVDDETAARNALAEVGKLLSEDPDFQSALAATKKPKAVAALLYDVYFAREMTEARLVIHRAERGHFIPVIHCRNMTTAMFVFAAYGGVEACVNCQKLFAVGAPRPDGSSSERYCTAACGQRYRQKLYRLRKKSQAKQSNRKGKH